MQARDRLAHMDGQPDRPALIGDGAGDRLPDPPRRVGGEAEAGLPIVLLRRAHQADIALLHEVEERQAAPDIALGDADDEPQIVAHHLLQGRLVARLDPLGERDLLLVIEQGLGADLVQVGAQRITIVRRHVRQDTSPRPPAPRAARRCWSAPGDRWHDARRLG